MGPERLRPEVELPARRVRPVCLGAAMSIVFALGARNIVESTMMPPAAAVAVATSTTMPVAVAAPPPMLRVALDSHPARAQVFVDGRSQCQTPCSLNLEARPGAAQVTFVRPGYAPAHLSVNRLGGDTRAEVVLRDAELFNPSAVR
jgi:hypothetical protein